jgi:hypothetical protein
MIKYAEINGTMYQVEDPETATLQSIKMFASNADARFSTAEAYTESDPVTGDETVKFRFNVGTKGVELLYATWNGQKYTLRGTQDPAVIKNLLAESDAAAGNADYVINGDTIEFFYRAGVKG